MNFILHTVDGKEMSEFGLENDLITNAQQFLEILMNAPSERLIIFKESLDESFFDLRTGLAGEMLQKVVNYRMRLAIIGNYNQYTSKSLSDFMYESNKGNVISFVQTKDEGLERLSMD